MRYTSVKVQLSRLFDVAVTATPTTPDSGPPLLGGSWVVVISPLIWVITSYPTYIPTSISP